MAGLVERVTFHNAENGFCVLRDLAAIRVDATPNGPGEVQLLAIWRYREAVQCLGQRGSAILSMAVLENCNVSDLVRRLGVAQHYAAMGMLIAVLDRLCEHYDAPRKARGALASAPNAWIETLRVSGQARRGVAASRRAAVRTGFNPQAARTAARSAIRRACHGTLRARAAQR